MMMMVVVVVAAVVSKKQAEATAFFQCKESAQLIAMKLTQNLAKWNQFRKM